MHEKEKMPGPQAEVWYYLRLGGGVNVFKVAGVLYASWQAILLCPGHQEAEWMLNPTSRGNTVATLLLCIIQLVVSTFEPVAPGFT